MKFPRVLLWSVAIVPALWAFVWSSLAARFPEPMAARRALGECLPQWDFGMLMVFDAEPAHLLSRVVHLSLLWMGVTIQWTAFANAVLAVSLAILLARLIWRNSGIDGIGRPLVFVAMALLTCSPAFGANWLHGERLGRFAVPLLFVASLLLCGQGRLSGVRALTVVALASLAPLCHALGAIVFLALVPALLGPGRMSWIIMVLLAGNIAAVSSFHPAGRFHLADTGLFGAVLEAPGATLGELLLTTGRLWPDLLPGRTLDERALGLASWLSPLLLSCGQRPAAAAHDGASTHRDGVWWSLVAFGLLAAAFHHERHGMSCLADQPLPVQTRVELLYGAFVLPIGIVGLLASRLGAAVWPLVGGAVVAVSLQNQVTGMDVLRAARVHAERVEATMVLPDILAGTRGTRDLPTRDLGELLLLEERDLVPGRDREWTAVIAAAINAEANPDRGRFTGGDALAQHGTVQPRLFGDHIGCVLIGVAVGTGPFHAVTYAIVESEPGGGRLTWTAKPVHALTDGARVCAIGIEIRSLHGVRLAGSYTVRGGMLVENVPAPAAPGTSGTAEEGK